MFQMGVKRWLVFIYWGYLKKVFFLRLVKDKKLINFVVLQWFDAFWQPLNFLKQL